MHKLICLFCFFSILIYGCKPKFEPSEVTKKFYSEKNSFDKLVSVLRNFKDRDSLIESNGTYLEKIKKTDKELYNEISNLGIIDVIEYRQSDCKNIMQYDFQTNWNSSLKDVFIDYNSCDSVETKKGYYRKDENANEFWGLGDGWKMWKLVKYLNYKQ